MHHVMLVNRGQLILTPSSWTLNVAVIVTSLLGNGNAVNPLDANSQNATIYGGIVKGIH